VGDLSRKPRLPLTVVLPRAVAWRSYREREESTPSKDQRQRAYSRALVLTCSRVTLATTWRLSEIHKTWKIHHLQLLGLPLLGIGEIRQAETTCCPLCEEEWRHLYRIHARSQNQPKAHERLLEQVLITHSLRQIPAKDDSSGLTRTITECKNSARVTE